MHFGLGTGKERENHQYLARIKTAGGNFRYIYDQAELKAYRAGGRIKNAAQNVANAAQSQTSNLMNRARAAANTAQNTANSYANQARQAVQNTARTASSATQQQYDKLRQNVNNMKPNLQKQYNNLRTNVQNTARTARTNLENAANTAYTNAQNKFNDFANRNGSDFDKAKGKAENAARTARTKLQNSANSYKTKAQNKLNDIQNMMNNKSIGTVTATHDDGTVQVLRDESLSTKAKNAAKNAGDWVDKNVTGSSAKEKMLKAKTKELVDRQLAVSSRQPMYGDAETQETDASGNFANEAQRARKDYKRAKKDYEQSLAGKADKVQNDIQERVKTLQRKAKQTIKERKARNNVMTPEEASRKNIDSSAREAAQKKSQAMVNKKVSALELAERDRARKSQNYINQAKQNARAYSRVQDQFKRRDYFRTGKDYSNKKG